MGKRGTGKREKGNRKATNTRRVTLSNEVVENSGEKIFPSVAVRPMRPEFAHSALFRKQSPHPLERPPPTQNSPLFSPVVRENRTMNLSYFAVTRYKLRKESMNRRVTGKS